MKCHEKGVNLHAQPVTSSRRAVESSIELTKDDKSSTWEEAARNSSDKVAKWDDLANDKKVRPDNHGS